MGNVISRRQRLPDGSRALVGYVVGSFSDPSLLLHRALDVYGDIDVACLLDVQAGTANLRSRDGGYDVAKVAEMFGGGGHRAAAGYPIDPGYTTLDVLDSLFGEEVFADD
jgi:oligoribonuclease NrnB/cAMP/cGMP phosphodiesterase (DHH superfamily)